MGKRWDSEWKPKGVVRMNEKHYLYGMCEEENKIIDTKYGKVRINKDGYYQITSRKEGNKGKLLHRLVWEDHYGKPVPKGYDIHHIDLNPLNNSIQNLQCVEHSLHMSFHHKNKIVSEKTKKKISEGKKGKPLTYEHKKKLSEILKGRKLPEKTKEKISKRVSEVKNTTGIFRVYKYKKKDYKQGFAWCYEYPNGNSKKIITRANLSDLEKEVKKRGLEWKIINNDKYLKSKGY